MAPDRLSEALDLVEVRSVLTGGIAARGGWWGRGPLSDPVKFFALVSGRARLTTDGVDEPVDLVTGDVAILTGRSWVAFEAGAEPRQEVQPESDFSTDRFASADRDADDIMIGGCVRLNEAGSTLLLESLPPLAHIRSADDDDRLLAALLRLFDEATAQRLGSAFAIRQYGQLFLLELLRSYVDQSALPSGWLRLLVDERLRPALDLLHGRPGRAWGLEELARAAAMSRTTFAERFREASGVPPLTYLGRWRMLLAQRALRDGDARVAALAEELGYGSESAFSTAFKRVVGESPLRYRARVRQDITGRVRTETP
ncbi:AraC family transcriptional regulator [Streptacidiphilus sp. PB12-B1b]|uniref:helix-turn-helix transcriptional regulator n=1 Tax=Streptacidiphilus sp. PB12-B1b TaxID=2705012 RepID=UPI0015FC5354|nr:AraC family transcriptional regulator [Streptacidiphilus sp. PB12-B1b]QMU76951.1 AraC family transcriptional regulator [Streptacidiphilus sp. PB12-B1b]